MLFPQPRIPTFSAKAGYIEPLCSKVERKSVEAEVVYGHIVRQTFTDLQLMFAFLLPITMIFPLTLTKTYLTPGWVFLCHLWFKVSVLFHLWVMEYTCS